jgi:hypothetical protein
MPTPQHRILNWLAESPIVRASDVVTIPAGFSFPFWWPYFKGISDGAILLVPILTAVLLLLRIWMTWRGKSPGD